MVVALPDLPFDKLEHDQRIEFMKQKVMPVMKPIFQNHDAKDFAELAKTPLPMPVLVLTGEKASGNFLIEQAKLVATNVQGQVIPGSGHWLMEEAPQTTIPVLTAFIDQPDSANGTHP